MQNEFEKFNTSKEKLNWAAKRMMGMQKNADETSENEPDFAWLRDDEIWCISEDLFDSIKDNSNSITQISKWCSDERWPVRIMMCFTKALFENTDLYRNTQKKYDWFNNFRDSDPDPTEP